MHSAYSGITGLGSKQETDENCEEIHNSFGKREVNQDDEAEDDEENSEKYLDSCRELH